MYAIRSYYVSQSEIHAAVSEEVDTSSFQVEGIANMPTYLQRFLAERSQEPGFTYQVEDDPVYGLLQACVRCNDAELVPGTGHWET